MFQTIQSLVSAYERRSVEDCMACMATGPRVMAYGTNEDEKRMGAEAVRQQFLADWAQTSAASMAVTWRHEVQHGDIGWIAADLRLRFATPHGVEESAGRATFVMVRVPQGPWLIEHMHFSAPATLAAGQSLVD